MVLTIGVLPIGEIEKELLLPTKKGLAKVFPKTTVTLVECHLPLSKTAFDRKRDQYRSNQILASIQDYAINANFSRILGVCDVDIFVPELNFVFGEATFPGKTSLISLWRLKPQFYGKLPNKEILSERILKEAVHEIGHTLGVKHCTKPTCVMHFSNSISDTDRKESSFCRECYLEAAIAIDSLK